MNVPHDDAIDALLRHEFDGPVPDEGFSERVMQRLPPRRRPHVGWIAGIVVGVVACGLSLWGVSLPGVGWHGWAGGTLSASAIALLLAIPGMSLLAACWAIAEADDG